MADTSIEWLESQSMLRQAKILSEEFSGEKEQWKRPYALPQSSSAIDEAQNWFTSYPASIITDEEESVLQYLGKRDFWKILQMLGLQGMHLGPMQIAGGLDQQTRNPSQDGGFDRISYHLSPEYGSYTEYLRMVEMGREHQGIIIGDLIPAHSGLGADFRLALAAYKEYPGIYHMVEIHPRDWKYLPPVEKGLSKNLNAKEVRLLKNKGYIVGELETTIFFHPDCKVSNWDVTKKIRGVDGISRRWVYLHYFKSSQPSYNWLDPSFGAQRIVAGDALFALFGLKNRILRLDANAFLGVETVKGTKKAWSEAHPLAMDATNTISMMIRKFGGYSFQELNVGPRSLSAFHRRGADLSYDFFTRPAYVNALIHSNCDLLKICYQLIQKHQVDSSRLIHAMQNHDELNYELKYLRESEHTTFLYHGESLSGAKLRKKIQEEDLQLCGARPFYNSVSGEGICSTMIGICAAALQVGNIYAMSLEEKERVKKAHLLIAFFNAMQPGIFAISGWDLVGALPLRKKEYISLSEKDHDERWRLRGAIDLLHCSDKKISSGGIPQAETLYSPLHLQLKDPFSFATKLQEILLARKTAQLAKAKSLGVLPTKNPSLLVLLHELPVTNALQITACNFSEKAAQETITIDAIEQTSAINLITRKAEKKSFRDQDFTLHLDPLEGKAILFSKGPETGDPTEKM
ncbi:MAG: maltose alpha-D-glucosyltransferase [Chlamydiota bacterium]